MLLSSGEEFVVTSELARLYIGKDSIAREVEYRIALRDTLFVNHLPRNYQIAPQRILKISPDSLANYPDTFNLTGPKYLLSFKLHPTQDYLLNRGK